MKLQVWFTSVNHPKDKVDSDNPTERTLRSSVKKEIPFGSRIEVEWVE